MRRLLPIVLILPLCGSLACTRESESSVESHLPQHELAIKPIVTPVGDDGFIDYPETADSRERESSAESRLPRHEPVVTHIVTPVDEDGFVDYLEAANTRHSKGVTPDNNWEVVVQRVFGPLKRLDPESEREYYRRLGIPRPSAEVAAGTYFQPLGSSGRDASPFAEKCNEQFWESRGPWTADEYPELAECLQMHSKHLDQLIEGSYRAKNYIPYVMSAKAHAEWVGEIRRFPGAAFVARLVGERDAHPAPLSRYHANEPTHRSRQIARALSKRMNLRIGQNDLAGARSDQAALRRIGLLLSQSGVTEYLAGRSFDAMADYGDTALIESGKLSEEACRRLLKELQERPRFPTAADLLDIDCRHATLDGMQLAARSQEQTKQALMESKQHFDQSAIDAVYAIDWNVAMKIVNQEYDAAVAAAGETDMARLNAHNKKYRRVRNTADKSFLESEDQLFPDCLGRIV